MRYSKNATCRPQISQRSWKSFANDLTWPCLWLGCNFWPGSNCLLLCVCLPSQCSSTVETSLWKTACIWLMSHDDSILSGWWFGTFFIFPNSWDDDPTWLIFFRGVETTNQLLMWKKWFRFLALGQATRGRGNTIVLIVDGVGPAKNCCGRSAQWWGTCWNQPISPAPHYICCLNLDGLVEALGKPWMASLCSRIFQ